MLERRRFLAAGLGFLAAPAIVRATSLMPVRALAEPVLFAAVPADLWLYHGWLDFNDAAVRAMFLPPDGYLARTA